MPGWIFWANTLNVLIIELPIFIKTMNSDLYERHSQGSPTCALEKSRQEMPHALVP